MKPKVLFLRKFSDPDIDFFKSHLSKFYDLIIPEDYSNKNIIGLAKDADVFIGNKVFKDLLDAAKKLKVIQIPGAGVDKLDLDLLRKNNITVCNSHSNAPYVAEYAVALLLSLVKKLSIHDRLMRKGEWFEPKKDEDDKLYLSDSLIGKTIGLLGFGKIARKIAELLVGFEVKFIATVRSEKKRQLVPSKVNFESLSSTLMKSDALFVALPLTEKTRDIISFNEFNLMKKTAYLVNVSRGPIVNQGALYTALKGRVIAGAAVDAWYDEYYSAGNKKYPSKQFPFHELENIILSPYRAGYIQRESPHLIDVVNNLTLYAEKNELMNVVDLEEGY